MAIKSQFFFIFSILFFSLQSYAQYYNYSGSYGTIKGSSALQLHAGATVFLGDLGGKDGKGAPFIKDINTKTIRPLLGVSYGFFPAEWLSINAGVNLTKVNGADSLISSTSGNAYGRFIRNLSFKSDIYEVHATVAFYPAQLLQNYEEARLRPFVSAGVGLFHFNPKAQLNGKWIDLNPLHLEGQGFPEYPDRKNYKLSQLYIPVTAGLSYRINDNFLVSLNAVFRKTFTDYIDDVSTRYINPALFAKYLTVQDAAFAGQLYFREKDPTEVSHVDKPRGESGKDSYTSVFFTFTYLLGSDY